MKYKKIRTMLSKELSALRPPRYCCDDGENVWVIASNAMVCFRLPKEMLLDLLIEQCSIDDYIKGYIFDVSEETRLTDTGDTKQFDSRTATVFEGYGKHTWVNRSLLQYFDKKAEIHQNPNRNWHILNVVENGEVVGLVCALKDNEHSWDKSPH